MIDAASHPWAQGCMDCTYGIADEHYQPPTGAVELNLERLFQAEKVGPAYFCECQAGQALRENLRRIRKRYDAMTSDFEGQTVQVGTIFLAAGRITAAKVHPHVEYESPDLRRESLKWVRAR